MSVWWRGLLGCWLVAVAAAAAAETHAPQALLLFNREVAELRTTLGGLDPPARVARAQRRFAELPADEVDRSVALQPFERAGLAGITLAVAGQPVFTLLAADLDPEERLTLPQAAERARVHLEAALRARDAQARPAVWMRGAAVAAGVVALLTVTLVLVLRLAGRLLQSGEQLLADGPAQPSAIVRALGLRVLAAGVWSGLLVVCYAGAMWLLDAFPWSQPWSDQLAGFVRRLGGWLVSGTMGAVPGLLTVLVVMALARAVQDALAAFLGQVQAGTLRVPFLHADTVGATRRLLTVLVWSLALAVAYPFLPGSGSEAFKGLSVLFGLMLTLGSTGVATQWMSGLVIVYSRSLRKGDFVAVNGIEGVVSEVGALAVKIVTMRNEEVTVPNGVITASAIHNYSKLAGEQGTLLSTRVTIGYDTAWRQVHALLMEAARQTAGVRAEPPPFVYQRALSDFYVEYELFAHIDRPLERVPILSALHGAIQDQFNRHGVQIMSPHFLGQPEHAVTVPVERWHAPPARPPAG